MTSTKRRLAILAVTGLFCVSAVALARADNPVAFGKRAVDDALAARGLKARVEIRVEGPGAPESFAIAFRKGAVEILAPDANGALYGALELAERVSSAGASALRGESVTGRPFLRDRGVNLFLTLPWDYAANDTDYDPRALVDPKRWWFANDGFWRTLFDQMARARLNWLDLHGAWDISVTDAPNLYAYFIQSDRFPSVGVSADIKAANLRQLNAIIELAHARGVRVSLMAYEARFHTPHSPKPYAESEADLYAYTREVVEKMIRQAPGLDAIGFRIGESGHGEAFFNCYLEAVKASGREIPLITRSWLARKSRVVPLAKASNDFTVEIKYNGEQWGTPYMLIGGRMAGWYSYSFEDYLSDSGTPDAARLWPGNPAPGGGTWPAEPYKIVWQVRANGTHRILPVFDPAAVRKAVRSMPLGTATGFVVEGLDTYYPKSPRYYLADPNDAYCDWTHERDWMFWNTWGRLGYDPDTPDEVFDALVADKLGPAGAPLVEAWKAASRIISTAFSSFSLGPDHRNHAIELEWGGDTAGYLAAGPFDTSVFRSIREAAAGNAAGGVDGVGLDGRLSPQETASRLASLAAAADRAGSIPLESAPSGERKRLKELAVACGQAARLGRYYAERFMSALRAAEAEAGKAGSAGAAGQASWHMREAEKEWAGLAACAFYRPFTERLRMHTNSFHWAQELPKVRAEAERLEKLAAPAADPTAPPARQPRLPSIGLDVSAEKIAMSIPATGLTRAWALVKPLPSSAFFHRFPMARRGDAFEYELKREAWGQALAAEIERGGRVKRIPGWEADAPYLVVPSLAGPTPLLYSSEEALTYLDPSVLTPSDYGLLLISSRASNFHRLFTVPFQRKLLDPVRRGLTLVVLAQEYSSGRYALDWLPRPLKVEPSDEPLFDPAGALGLPKIEGADILRQRFLPSEGWEVPGNGGLAVLRWGEGRIILVNARLLERLHIPGSVAALSSLLALSGREKPVVVVDAGTDGTAWNAPVVTDFMTARGVPFLTLGEVIARTQGASAKAPIPGRLDDDDLLAFRGLRGNRMVNDRLEKKVKAAAARPVPASREEFERRREADRPELMKCLGLDPLPPRTPLNARVTGVIKRPGYRIEKIVFDSRPEFPVTAHLYIPEGAAGKKLPVIVNPHGHWGWKKQEPTVQSRLIGQVLRGYLAVVVDSPGWSFEGDRRVERRWAGTHDDLRLILGSQNATSVYVWDLTRTLDYLATRPEADMSRVGLTGASGGGLATMWAFAAEPRFACAASVVYASSLEVNPHNGCLCNHVPGSLRLGDRADVLSFRAPAPVLIIGAEEDEEFPAEGMKLTGEKLGRLWGLFGRSADAWLRQFPGGHDYSRPMRETALGFFDKYLRGEGDGSPVPEPRFATEPPDSPELLVLAEPPSNLLTMRGIAREMFDESAFEKKRSPQGKPATARTAKRSTSQGAAETGIEAVAGSTMREEYFRLNGGLPASVDPELKRLDEAGGKVRCTFVSEPGLTVPAIFWEAHGAAKAFVVLVIEEGKQAAAGALNVERLRAAGIACAAIDPRGIGELEGLDLRLTTYLGQAPAFGMGWDIARALAALAPEATKIAVVARGPAAGQAALAAALMEPRIGFVAGLATLKEFTDAFREDVTLLAVQPRANYSPALSELRGRIKAQAVWSFLGDPDPDWAAALIGWSAK
jgi:dienelactone hydrolase